MFRQGGATRIAVSGIDPKTRGTRFNKTTELQSDDDLFKALDTLARDVRRELGESLIGIARTNDSLADVTTGSVAALKLYTRARDMYTANQADAALPLLQQALSIAPGFAMAHRLIARVYETSGNATQAREHRARAYEYRDSLTEKEQLHVEASYFKGNGEYRRRSPR